MPHFLSRITSKLFILIVSVMICLTGIFSVVSYMDAIDGFKRNEMNLLKTVVRTQSLQLESIMIGVEGEITSDEEYQIIRAKLEQSLTNVNRVNELEDGLSFILIRNKDNLTEIISSGRTAGPDNAGVYVQSILESLPMKPIEKGVESSAEDESLFYAYPITFPGFSSYRGYLYVQESISDELYQAKKILLQRLVVMFIIITLMAILGKKYIKVILRQEGLTKNRLKEYASLADERNKELERLSFVLGKSEHLILLTDQAGKIEWINQQNKGTNNYSAEELSRFIGREVAEVSRYPKIKDAIETVNRTKKKYIYETKDFNEEMHEFWSSTTITPILNDVGEVENLLFVDADVSRLKKAEQEISKLANFAQENTHALMRFRKNGEVLYANEPGKILLDQWGAKVHGVLSRASVLNTIRLAAELDEEQKLNLESNNRIFRLRFHPIQNKDYINVYAEDITEIKLAEKEYLDRASVIEKHNLDITDSINYAKRIQDSIIPGEDHIRKYFNDSFLIYKPKDIVSGDFVWLHELKPKEEYLLALADCTGHGVPGAMMTIIGHSLLNEIVQGEEINDPALILEELNKEVIKTLRQKTEAKSSDGMDVSIVKINIPELTITFAGAYQDMYLLNGKLNVFKGDRQPIGGKHHIFDRQFQNQSIKISKGDSIFLTSDGFVDQFGGPDDKKFLKKRFSKLICSNSKYSMQAQSFIFEEAFQRWKGAKEQIDDISVVGIKF